MGCGVERCELRVDSCGDGKTRGGLGLRREVRILGAEGTFSELSDRNLVPPFGVCGGHAAAPNRFTVVRDGQELQPSDIPGKVSAFPLRRDDVVVMESAGGGGYGLAHERDVALVLRDVLEGYMSADKARARYGVVVVGVAVDDDATHRLRQQLASAGLRFRIVPEETDEFSDGRRICRLAAEDMRRFGIKEDALIELINPVGAPLRAWARSHGIVADGTTRLGPIGQAVLAKTSDDTIELRVITG